MFPVDPNYASYLANHTRREANKRTMDGLAACLGGAVQVEKALRQLTLISLDEAAELKAWYAL